MGLYLKDTSMHLSLELGEREVFGLQTVIHCHHYNSRLQKTIEGSKLINGKEIFRRGAALVFHRQIENTLQSLKITDLHARLQAVSELYSFLGFGSLDFSSYHQLKVISPVSHFAEGWKSGYKQESRKVCTFAEGFLEGTLLAATGKSYEVRETCCVNEGAKHCEFELCEVESLPYHFSYLRSKSPEVDAKLVHEHLHHQGVATKVNMLGIQLAVFGMPLFGNSVGIIPAFNVYLAHMPRDFYNLVCLEFVNEMSKLGMNEVAQNLLKEDAETCALNTFAGIMQSEEWSALIQPMIERTEDNLYALIAVSNALGWGVTRINKHVPFETLELSTANGYESIGALSLQNDFQGSDCLMLSGVASGLMSLVYGSGDFSFRKGLYLTEEANCVSRGDSACTFSTKAAEQKRKQVA